ncbi:substrate-binding domain-containing protein [uncultured Pseudokineococcus sp.]|uniref:substrate-binding domain-containing protein n=1 Tax=uncultured Pseudokineococcus sp. TaxID=1642928 RepID=UPI00262D446E|nr:substrate-binding domain-containing protein [uncultured Pseudokineococcus sp.]
MWKPRTRATVVLAALALTAAGCSSSGGAPEAGSGGGESGGGSGDPQYTVAMVTHAAAGDTFFDIIRAGADVAAGESGVEYTYANSDQPNEQATLIQNAVDSQVDAIAVSMPNVPALTEALANAEAADIPVFAFNAGLSEYEDVGALAYFGQDEAIAGAAAGERLTEEGAQNVLCVLQAQGQAQLEARCDGVADAFGGAVEKLYVTGTDMPSVQSTITAKLAEDPSIDHVLTLGAPFALTAAQSVEEAGSEAAVVTFDTNAELVDAIESGDVQWAVDQQPYLQGYEAIDAAALYLSNGNVLGGGEAVLTGPAFVDQDNIASVAEYARAGTR